MKPLGIVRSMDDLGRVVVPKEIRRTIGIKEGDEMEIFATGRGVYFQKYNPNDETTPDIFREMGCAEVPVQPPATPATRKKVVIHDRDNNRHYYLLLTPSQIALLDWLNNEYIFDTDRYEWEILTDHEFEEI
jgi:AbrB family looped-hinge helix DNA binding protein